MKAGDRVAFVLDDAAIEYVTVRSMLDGDRAAVTFPSGGWLIVSRSMLHDRRSRRPLSVASDE